MSDLDKPQPVNNESGVALTVRMIMNGKEVGSIIGKGGEIINSIREDSHAKICLLYTSPTAPCPRGSSLSLVPRTPS